MITYNVGDRVYHRTMGYGTVIEIVEATTPETNFTPQVVEHFILTQLEHSNLTIRSKVRVDGLTDDLFSSAEEATFG